MYNFQHTIWTEIQATLKKKRIITDSNIFIDRYEEDYDELLQESKDTYKKDKKFVIYNDTVDIFDKGEYKTIRTRISIGDGENKEEVRFNMHQFLKIGHEKLNKYLKRAMNMAIKNKSWEVESSEVEIELERQDRIYIAFTCRIVAE